MQHKTRRWIAVSVLIWSLLVKGGVMSDYITHAQAVIGLLAGIAILLGVLGELILQE